MKIEEQVLGIEQMKHLQELGVDTSDASMYWVRAKRIIGKQRNDVLGNEMGKWRLSLSKSIVLPAAWAVESVPTYTIGDIVEKLPKCCVSKLPLTYFYDLLCLVAENHKELL